MTFIPAVGHIKPQFYKEIVCTILVAAPTVLFNEKIDLIICKVVYSDPQQKLLSWDERQNLIVWEADQEQEVEDEEAISISGSGSLKTNL